MIEPTETESKETLDGFCDAMKAIAGEARTDADLVTTRRTPPVGRLDEAAAAASPTCAGARPKKVKAFDEFFVLGLIIALRPLVTS